MPIEIKRRFRFLVGLIEQCKDQITSKRNITSFGINCYYEDGTISSGRNVRLKAYNSIVGSCSAVAELHLSETNLYWSKLLIHKINSRVKHEVNCEYIMHIYP